MGVKNLSLPADDAPHRHLGLLEQLARVEAEELAHEGYRHFRVLTLGLGLKPRLQLGVRLLWEQPGDYFFKFPSKRLIGYSDSNRRRSDSKTRCTVLQGVQAD